MDPATEFTGGQPIAADSLYGIIPTSLMNNNRMIDLDFGPDGALYVADYGGSNFAISNANNSVRRFAYIGGADTPGPDPQVVANAEPGVDHVRVQHRQVRRHLVQVGLLRRRHRHRRERHPHVPERRQRRQADGHADRDLRRRRRPSAKTIDVPVPTTVPSTVTARRAEDARPDDRRARHASARFVPGVGEHLRRQHDGERRSRRCPNAALSVVDQSRRAPASWSTPARRWPQRLRARATNAANPNTAFANITGTPLTLLTWSAHRSATTR